MAEQTDSRPPESTASAGADFAPLGVDGGVARFRMAGRFDAQTTAAVWEPALAALDKTDGPVAVDGADLEYCGAAGVAFLLEIRRHCEARDNALEMVDLPASVARTLDPLLAADLRKKATPTPPAGSVVDELGRGAVETLDDIRDIVAFVGELTVAIWRSAKEPRRVRWRDVWVVTETAGVNALPIVALIGFIIGLVMAFQAAVPMRQYALEIFVADLVALSMLRELGPLMTAIILAGRSGSAFAAEIGTMKVNEEIDAMTTMGIDPVRFLVVTRVMAATAMTPLLSVFATLMGLIGGAIVLMSMGYPLIAYVNEVLSAVDVVDLTGGLVKAVVFGFLVAGIGCLRGLRTRTGATAVGQSTTSAVVSAIVLIALADAVFSVAYYFLDI